MTQCLWSGCQSKRTGRRYVPSVVGCHRPKGTSLSLCVPLPAENQKCLQTGTQCLHACLYATYYQCKRESGLKCKVDMSIGGVHHQLQLCQLRRPQRQEAQHQLRRASTETSIKMTSWLSEVTRPTVTSDHRRGSQATTYGGRRGRRVTPSAGAYRGRVWHLRGDPGAEDPGSGSLESVYPAAALTLGTLCWARGLRAWRYGVGQE
ncbi:hypothetical protein J4Q44_G00264120 [Coregonus suidteri]|uniref:Colipase C-terminal domain-containing protein n=1 Tax=Coregonus suidteri TaxID=861788 RepID=A0AAN8L4B8_9TELE